MANISAIKLPSGNTYAIKDNISGYTTNTGTITKVSTTAGSHSTIDISSGAASFNVPTKTSHITNDSGFLTNSTLYEANLNWGGKDFSASYSPVDAAMIDVLGANRFAFLKADGLTIEYSTDGGSSWVDYGATDSQKVGLFSSGQLFYLGKHTAAGSCTTDDQLRITIATSACSLYTTLNKIAILLSTQGSTVQVLIEKALESTPTTFITHKDWTNISGWSGWNILNINGLTTYGNTASTQYGRIRFTFKATAVNTTYTAANIFKIQGFGGQGWITPSNMASTGHLYSYDSSQNATFPAKVTATGLLTANAGVTSLSNIILEKPSDVEWSSGGSTLEPGIWMKGNNNKIFKFKFSTSGNNVDVGWDWNARDGAGAYFRSSSSNGAFGFYARNASDGTELAGTPAGALTWGNRRVITSNDTSTNVVGSVTQPVYIDSNGRAQTTTYSLGANVPADAKFTDFVGTDGTAAGTRGLVPAPAATDSDKFLSADGTWAEPPGSGSSISYVTKSENTYTTTSSSSISTIPIGIQSYTSTDVLLVDINGLDLIQGTDYTISGTNIVLTTPITTSGTKVHFTALKMTTATTSDYATLKGEKGDDGHSPVVTASKSGTTTTVYVDGSSIASINDGTNGTHTISYTPIVTGGAQIGTITIDNTNYPLYAPAVVWG